MRKTARRTAAVALIAAILTAGLTGCGSSGRPSARTSDAANRLEPMLRETWSGSFAGLEIDGNRLVIYRKPDAHLDAAVREHASGVEVEFRDARYSIDDLEPIVDRVNADRPYWRQRGIQVQTVTPLPDGQRSRDSALQTRHRPERGRLPTALSGRTAHPRRRARHSPGGLLVGCSPPCCLLSGSRDDHRVAWLAPCTPECEVSMSVSSCEKIRRIFLTSDSTCTKQSKSGT